MVELLKSSNTADTRGDGAVSQLESMDNPLGREWPTDVVSGIPEEPSAAEEPSAELETFSHTKEGMLWLCSLFDRSGLGGSAKVTEARASFMETIGFSASLLDPSPKLHDTDPALIRQCQLVDGGQKFLELIAAGISENRSVPPRTSRLARQVRT